MSKCMFIVRNVLKKESKGWHIKFKDKMVQELQGMIYTRIFVRKRYCNVNETATFIRLAVAKGTFSGK